MNHSRFFREENLHNPTYSDFFESLSSKFFKDNSWNGFIEHLIWRMVGYIEARASVEDDSRENTRNEFLDYAGSKLASYLSPGYKFNPEDYELIIHYLKKKVNKERLPINTIAEVNIYDYNPEELEVNYKPWGKNEWYFFTPTERKYPNGGRRKRSAGEGYWKATGADKSVAYENEVIGFKKTLVFYRGKHPQGEKTNWVMREYKVAQPPPLERRDQQDKRLDECILSKICRRADRGKHKRSRDAEEEEMMGTPESKVLRFSCDQDQEDGVNTPIIQQSNFFTEPLQNPSSQLLQNPNIEQPIVTLQNHIGRPHVVPSHQPVQSQMQQPNIQSQFLQNPTIIDSQPLQNPNVNGQPLQDPNIEQSIFIFHEPLQNPIEHSPHLIHRHEHVQSQTQIPNIHTQPPQNPIINYQPLQNQFEQPRLIQKQMQQPATINSHHLQRPIIENHIHEVLQQQPGGSMQVYESYTANDLFVPNDIFHSCRHMYSDIEWAKLQEFDDDDADYPSM